MNYKTKNRINRHKRLRAKIKGTTARPRVSVFRSNKHIFAQVIDDSVSKTITSSIIKSSKNTAPKGTKTEIAEKVGGKLAKKIKEKGITKVVFDRSGFKYHGRVKALAEALRKSGIKF